MATYMWVNTGSGNGLLPDGTKPLHEPMLTNHWQGLGLVALLGAQFHKKYSRYQFLCSVKKIQIYNYSHISQG